MNIAKPWGANVTAIEGHHVYIPSATCTRAVVYLLTVWNNSLCSSCHGNRWSLHIRDVFVKFWELIVKHLLWHDKVSEVKGTEFSGRSMIANTPCYIMERNMSKEWNSCSRSPRIHTTCSLSRPLEELRTSIVLWNVLVISCCLQYGISGA